MSKNDNRMIAIYSRKSKFTGKGESVENQIEMCKQHIKLYLDVEDETKIAIYEDEGFTGANTDRPQFQQLLKDIKDKKVSILVCYKLDRVSRNVFDFCTFIEELSTYNVDFVSVKERFDTCTSAGKAMLMMCSVFAQFERDTIAERIRDNMTELAKTGRWLGGNTPMGYKSEKLEKLNINGKKTSLFKLTLVDEEEQIVKLLFDKFIELKSQTKLESYLLKNDIRTKNQVDFKRWGIKNILKNPVYATADKDTLEYFKRFDVEIHADERDFDGTCGIMAYNKTTKDGKKGTVKQKDVTEWIIAIGKHKGLISGKDWVAVQDLLNQNGNKSYRKPIKNTSILAGTLRCTYCGSIMRPKLKQNKASNGDIRFDYICDLKMRSNGVKCSCKNINGNETDTLVFNGIKELARPTSAFYKELLSIATNKKMIGNSTNNEIKSLEQQLIKTETAIKDLIDKIQYINIDLLEDIQNQIRELKIKKADIETRIKELSKDAPTQINDKETAQIIIDILNNYVSKFDELDLIEKRNILKIFIGSLTTDGEKIYLDLIGTRNHTQTDQNVLLSDSCKRNINVL